MRRVTTPDGEHWFVAADVATDLGYANTRQALGWHVAPECQMNLGDLARSVYGVDASSKIAGHGLKKSMRMVNLRGLIALVNGCTKPECEPFKTWVAEVIETIHRDGSYALEPSPAQTPATGTPAYVMPQAVADAIVRLEQRNLEADERLAAIAGERNELLRQISGSLSDIAESLRNRRNDRSTPAPKLTPQELLAAWKAKNLVVTEDVHSVAAYLAPALLNGGAHYRVTEIANRTGLSHDRVHDCLRMLLKRGCMRQAGCTPEGAPVYVLP
ncbi:Bro-N domain-containing protein [Streptomyces sp. S.PB5]|uniref:BRO-N domain-containing protein n=1 Tax=Streptomyces sp. S.PB5 TaxID=3020844 RepID=UPI0025AFB3CE|nr:Bro-N domain-containing protein [Streptomyces sp. S.PB5]MDN3023608.1 Bro-N domain-containing protein [Streptomyces sp. S.PB5]